MINSTVSYPATHLFLSLVTGAHLQSQVSGAIGVTNSFKYHSCTMLSPLVLYVAASNGVIIRSIDGKYYTSTTAVID